MPERLLARGEQEPAASEPAITVRGVDASLRERQERFGGNLDEEISVHKREVPLETLAFSALVKTLVGETLAQNPDLDEESIQKIAQRAVLATLAAVRHHSEAEETEHTRL